MPSGTKYMCSLRWPGLDAGAVDRDRACVGGRQAGQASKERRLARAVRSDQPEDLVRADGKRGAAQGPERAEALREIVNANARSGRGNATPNKLAEVCVLVVVSWYRGVAPADLHPTPPQMPHDVTSDARRAPHGVGSCSRDTRDRPRSLERESLRFAAATCAARSPIRERTPRSSGRASPSLTPSASRSPTQRGAYTLRDVPAGRYVVTTSAIGRKSDSSRVTVTAGSFGDARTFRSRTDR